MTDTPDRAIPEDVMRTAQKARAAFADDPRRSDLTVRIADAILAERERCAKVADDLYGTYDGTPFDDGSGSCGFNAACRDIADAILKGAQP